MKSESGFNLGDYYIKVYLYKDAIEILAYDIKCNMPSDFNEFEHALAQRPISWIHNLNFLMSEFHEDLEDLELVYIEQQWVFRVDSVAEVWNRLIDLLQDKDWAAQLVRELDKDQEAGEWSSPND